MDAGVPVLWHYDGVSARRREPMLVPGPRSFRLIDGWGEEGPFAWDALIALDATGNARVFGIEGRGGWRLALPPNLPPELEARLPRPERYGRWIDRFGLGKAAIVLTLVSAVLVVGVATAPHWIAPYVPRSWEKRLGDAIVGDFGGRLCNGPGGQAALDALARRLDPGGAPVEVRVANIPIENAVALPGGRIILFRGLLTDAQSPDEIAGVLGHEMGHVRNRDVMEGLLRQAGLSVLLGGLNGNVGGTFNALLSATYSREAEARADQGSIDAMRRADISPVATAAFFKRLARAEAKLGNAEIALGYLSSHPLSRDRERHFTESAVKGAAYRPALTPEQWKALTDICRNNSGAQLNPSWFP